MKDRIISILQRILGFENYLFVFALFIYHKLRWDKNEKDFLKLFDLIKDEGIVLDIGANIGVMTAHFAKRLKNTEVYSFEPIPSNLKALKRLTKFKRLKNVHIFGCALSNYNGKIELVMPIVNSARKQGLTHVVNQENKEQNKGDFFEVSVKKLDDILELNNTDKKISAIKIDVEGHELSVLQGGLKLIQKNKPIIYCELWANDERKEMFEFMQNLNYSPMVVENGSLCNYKSQKTQNFFFCSN